MHSNLQMLFEYFNWQAKVKEKEWIIFVDCIYDKKVEGADKTKYLLQVLNSAIFIFQA